MDFRDEFEFILFDWWRKVGYIFWKVFWNGLFVLAPVFFVFLGYKVFGWFVFCFLVGLLLFYIFSSSDRRLGFYLRSVDLHADVVVNTFANAALVFEVFVFVAVLIFYNSFVALESAIFPILAVYFNGAFVLSLLNLKPHLTEKLLPFSEPFTTHFLELPRPEPKIKEEDKKRAHVVEIPRPRFIEFEKIDIPVVTLRYPSFSDLFKIEGLPFTLMVVFVVSLVLDLRSNSFGLIGFSLVDFVLLFPLLVAFVVYFLYMLVFLDREEQVYSTSLVLSFLVISSSFIVVFYLIGVHGSSFYGLLGIDGGDGLSVFEELKFVRFQFVVSSLVALVSALLVVELPSYLVLSNILERRVEALRADFQRFEKELNELLGSLEIYSRIGDSATVNVLRERIRVLMSKLSSIEEEIVRVESKSASPVPLLDKILSGGALGLIVALFTVLA